MELDPIAIYAATISTLLGIFEVIKYYRDRPQLEVQASFSPLGDEACITITNSGTRACAVKDCGFELVFSKYEYELLSDQEPKHRTAEKVREVKKKLDVGEPPEDVHFPNPGFAYYHVRRVWAREETGRKSRSRKWPLYPKKWFLDRPRPRLMISVHREPASETLVHLELFNSGNVPISVKKCFLKSSSLPLGKEEATDLEVHVPFGIGIIQSGHTFQTPAHKFDSPVDSIQYAWAMDDTRHIWRSQEKPLVPRNKHRGSDRYLV